MMGSTPLNIEATVRELLPFVKRIASDLIASLPHNVDVEDLIQEGVMALIEAISRYDPRKGAKFSSYVLKRVKGAMYDYLRKLDWLPKSRRKNLKCLERAIMELEAREGRYPTDVEIARYCGFTVEEVTKIRMDMVAKQLLALDAYMEDEELQIADYSQNPEKTAYKELLKELLVEAIKKLSEKERLVLSMKYEKGMNFKEIGLVLGVSESRVSQIHSLALVKLKSMLYGEGKRKAGKR